MCDYPDPHYYETKKTLAAIRANVAQVLDELKTRYVGAEVTLLNCGKYSGRAAIIMDIDIIAPGNVMFQCVVLRSGAEPIEGGYCCGDFLNSDRASRSFRSFDDFVVLP